MPCRELFREIARVQDVILSPHELYGGGLVYVLDQANVSGNSVIGERVHIASVFAGQKGEYVCT
jgi:hypothetical protein